jgi:hypothetical protein
VAEIDEMEEEVGRLTAEMAEMVESFKRHIEADLEQISEIRQILAKLKMGELSFQDVDTKMERYTERGKQLRRTLESFSRSQKH